MSLTGLLINNNQIKTLFASLPNLKNSFVSMDKDVAYPSKPPIIVQRGSRGTPVIGQAYDYMFRAYVQRLNGIHQEQNGHNLAASIVVEHLEDDIINLAFNEIIERRNDYITGVSALTADCIRDAVRLGQLEQLYRSGVGETENLLQVSDEDVDDLQALMEATNGHSRLFCGSNIVCNPSFGEAVTALVDGADGDIIIGDMLIDVKTESEFRCKIGQSRQLIAYWILSCLTPGFKPEIKQLAIWNPRYCRLVSIHVEDICRAINMIDFVDQFVSIITADNFEGSEHLSPLQRRTYANMVKNQWESADNPIRQLYQNEP